MSCEVAGQDGPRFGCSDVLTRTDMMALGGLRFQCKPSAGGKCCVSLADHSSLAAARIDFGIHAHAHAHVTLLVGIVHFIRSVGMY